MGFLANYIRNLASMAAFRQPMRPLLFSYYVTHRCPLACRYCSDGQGRPFREDVEPLIRLSRQIGVTYMVNLYSWNRGTKTPRLPNARVTDHLLTLKRKYPEFITLTSHIEQFDNAISVGGIGDCQTGRLLMNIDNRGNVARCTETLDAPAGNILTDDPLALRDRLLEVQQKSPCAQCWTSCRGFAECMHKPPRWRQFREFFISVRPRA